MFDEWFLRAGITSEPDLSKLPADDEYIDILGVPFKYFKEDAVSRSLLIALDSFETVSTSGLVSTSAGFNTC